MLSTVARVLRSSLYGTDYTLSWPFEDGTFQGWRIMNGDQVPGAEEDEAQPAAQQGRLYLPAVFGPPPWATYHLPAPTRSWRFEAVIGWEPTWGEESRIQGAGLGYHYVDHHQWSFYSGRAPGSLNLKWVDDKSPDFLGLPLTVYGQALWDSRQGGPVDAGEARLRINYNLPSNPGVVTFDFEPLSFTAGHLTHRHTAGRIATDPKTGKVLAVDQISLGGPRAWGSHSFAQVAFSSFNELAARPATRLPATRSSSAAEPEPPSCPGRPLREARPAKAPGRTVFKEGLAQRLLGPFRQSENGRRPACTETNR